MQKQTPNAPAPQPHTAATGSSNSNAAKPKGQSKYTPKPCILVVGRPQGGQSYTFRIEARHTSRNQARKQRDRMMAEHPERIYLVLDETAPLYHAFQPETGTSSSGKRQDNPRAMAAALSAALAANTDTGEKP